MKKVKIALLVLIATIFVLPACKKGKDDPFISFRSRDGRLMATWKLTNIAGTESDVTTQSSATTSVSKTITYDGSTETTTTTTTMTGFPTQTNTSTSIFTFQMTLGKLGVASYICSPAPDKYTGSGTWQWAYDSKNKDVITLSWDGSGSMFNGTYNIDELKHKEMIFKVNTQSTSDVSPQTETKSTQYTYTFTMQ